MIYLFRWLFGYIKFYFKNGFSEDFITDCFAQGMELRDIEDCGEYITAVCNLKNYKKLHRIAYKHGGVVKIMKKKGLPFVLLPLKNRFGFFIGMICFCAILSFLNAFIWNVEIVGNSRVSDTAILTYLENNHFQTGVMWGSVDRTDLCWKIMSDFEDFSWVHINKFGTTARVEVNETRQQDADADEEKLQGIGVFRRELSTTVSREQKDITLKDTKDYYTLRFFTAEIPLYFKKLTGDQSYESDKALTIKNVELPIGYTKSEERFFRTTPRTMSDDELKALAKKRLEYLEQKEFDGFEIVNQTEHYDLAEDKCTISCSYIIRRK